MTELYDWGAFRHTLAILVPFCAAFGLFAFSIAFVDKVWQRLGLIAIALLLFCLGLAAIQAALNAESEAFSARLERASQ